MGTRRESRRSIRRALHHLALTALAVAAVLSAAGLGCASAAPRDETRLEVPPSDKALVYFFLARPTVLSPVWILEGDTLLAELRGKTYARVELEPGPHWLWRRTANASPDDYERGLLFFEAGSTYCFRVDLTLEPTSPETLVQLINESPWRRWPERGFLLETVSPELQETARERVQGCAAASATPAQLPPGLPVEPSPGKALVYFFSPRSWAERTWVFEGQRLIVSLRGSGYAFAYFEPGLHWLWSYVRHRGYSAGAPFAFRPGETSTILVNEDGAMRAPPAAFELMRLAANPHFGPSTPTAGEEEKAGQTARDFARLAGPPEGPKCTPPMIGEGEFQLAAGTRIPMRLIENATSNHTLLGQTLRFETTDDVRVGETIVVPRGLPVDGTVRNVSPASVGPILVVEIRKLELPDSRAVPLLGLVRSLGSPSATQETLAQLAASGVAQSTEPSATPESSLAALGISVLAGMFATGLRGDEAWLLAGMPATAYVRCDAAVTEASPRAPHTLEAAPAGSSVAASSTAPILVPVDGRVTGGWSVRLETPSPPQRVWIASVDGIPLLQPIAPSRVRPRGEWQEVVFAVWPTIRYAHLDPSGPVAVPLVLEGLQPDGSPFFARMSVSVRFAEP